MAKKAVILMFILLYPMVWFDPLPIVKTKRWGVI